MANDYAAQGVQLVAISSNSVQTHPQDGPENMREEAAQHDFPYPYLYDESQSAAQAYMAACTPDSEVARQMQQHAIEESWHSCGYVTLFGLIFPEATDEALQARLKKLSPGYTWKSALTPTAGSPYAYPATVDELIQMNIAEIRTRIYHQLQRPVLLDHYCDPARRSRVEPILDSLLLDETRHIAYTARLIERAAQTSGEDLIVDLMLARVGEQMGAT